jgi:hypothetical protein
MNRAADGWWAAMRLTTQEHRHEHSTALDHATAQAAPDVDVPDLEWLLGRPATA